MPSTPYPLSSVTTINLTTSEANTTGFVSVKELEATQVVQSTQVAQATQPKRRGRPPGSKDKVPRKRAKKGVPGQEGEQMG